MQETASPQPYSPISPHSNFEQSQNSQVTLKRNNSALYILIAVVAVLLIGGGGFYLASFLNTPTLVKEKVQTAHPVYEDLNRALKKLTEFIKETAPSDPAGLARTAEKGKGILKTAKDNHESLTTLVSKLEINQLKSYKERLTDYLNKSKELVSQGEENVKSNSEYVEIVRSYQDLVLSLSGVANYVFSQPSRYIEELKKAEDKENAILSNVEKIKFDLPSYQKYNEVFAKNLRDEVGFYKKMEQAVQNRDNDAITSAQKEFIKINTENSQELSRISDKVKQEVDEINSALESLERKISSEYESLKNKYNF